MQQGGKASVTLFRYVANWRLYPCSITGATELGYLLPFACSTRRSIRLLRFCLIYTSSIRLSGNRFETYSSSSAFLLCWAGLYDGGERLSRGEIRISNILF